MEKDIREFLEEVGEAKLEARDVLIPNRRHDYLLNNKSVNSLLRLMVEYEVSRLVAEDRGWFLEEGGKFENPGSQEIKEGNVRDLENRGSVFTRQNRRINPFFKSKSKESSAD